jgi:hypothetical protein
MLTFEASTVCFGKFFKRSLLIAMFIDGHCLYYRLFSTVDLSEAEGSVEMEDAHRSDQNTDMKHEAARLATFHNWPLSFIR